MANVIKAPYPMFFEEDGRPVEGGHVYIGVSGLNPISNPLACFYDEAMTIPAAAKNIRITGGYITYKGAPRNLYVPGDYSLLVQDKNGSTIYSSLANTIENSDLLLTLPRGMLSRAMRVPDSYNFDEIIDSGLYSWTNGGTSNFPVGCAAADLYGLFVQAAPDGTGIIYQRLVDFSTGPTSALYTWERQSVNAGVAWTPWIATNIPSGYGVGWQTALSAPVVLPEDPRGLTCSNAPDADHDITISAGGAANSTRVIWLALAAAITKKIDEAWAVGDNAGGLFAGAALAANTPYYMFIIRKDSNGSIDAGYDDNISGTNAPAGYTYKRMIRRQVTDAAANIIPTTQTGDYVKFKSRIIDFAYDLIANTNRIAYPLSAPPNVIARTISTAYWSSPIAVHYLWVDDADFPDAAASATNHTHTPTVQNARDIAISLDIKTDATRNIYARGNSTAIGFEIITLGWIDDRGRIA